MPTYLALLRGVNVSGQKKLPMARLRGMLAALGFSDVTTYIQSGNVVFGSETVATGDLRRSIETAISGEFGLEVPVVIRASSELAAAIAANPYIAADADPARLAIAFLAEPPTPERAVGLDASAHLPDECTLVGEEVHLHCPSGFGRTRLTNAFVERQLGVTATTRNWRTVNRLLELAPG